MSQAHPILHISFTTKHENWSLETGMRKEIIETRKIYFLFPILYLVMGEKYVKVGAASTCRQHRENCVVSCD